MEHPSLMQILNYPELKRKMPFCVRENKAQARNGVKRISRIRIDKMTFKKEIRIPIKILIYAFLGTIWLILCHQI